MFDFLKSVRFWKLVIIGVIGALQLEGIISAPIADAIYVILGGSVIIRTIDRNLGDALK